MRGQERPGSHPLPAPHASYRVGRTPQGAVGKPHEAVRGEDEGSITGKRYTQSINQDNRDLPTTLTSQAPTNSTNADHHLFQEHRWGPSCNMLWGTPGAHYQLPDAHLQPKL